MNKIFFDHSIFLHQKNGGISKYFCRLYNDLKKYKKNDINIYAPIIINDNLYNLVKEKKYNIKLNKIPRLCTKLFYLINNLLNYIYILYYNPNIIHFTYYNYFLSKILQIPFVVTVHDLIHEKLYDGKFKLKRQYILNKAKKIICISNNTKKELIKFYNVKENKIEIIYHGIKQIRKSRYKKKILSCISVIGEDIKALMFCFLLTKIQNI